MAGLGKGPQEYSGTRRRYAYRRWWMVAKNPQMQKSLDMLRYVILVSRDRATMILVRYLSGKMATELWTWPAACHRAIPPARRWYSYKVVASVL